MIVFNGIELDLYKGSLKPPILKKSLASLQKLEDRKGTVSTEFNIPRTPKNELAFNNATVPGSNTTAIGEVIIYIDGNVYDQGTLYLRGFNDSDLACLFIGSEISIVDKLKNIQVSDLFIDFLSIGVYNDANFKFFLTDVTLSGIRTFFSTPLWTLNNLINGLPTIENGNFFANAKDIITQMFAKIGYTVNSNILNSDYFNRIYFAQKNKYFASNAFANSTIVPTAISQNIMGGAAFPQNNTVTAGTGKYILGRDIDILKINGLVEIDFDDSVESAQLHIKVGREFSTIDENYINTAFNGNTSFLSKGSNYINFETEFKPSGVSAFMSGDFIKLELVLKLKNGVTFPLSNFSMQLKQLTISHDDIQEDDGYFIGNNFKGKSCFNFFSDFLKDYNLVYTLENNEVIIELQDSGYSPADDTILFNSIVNNTIDITKDISSQVNINIDNDLPATTLLTNKYVNGKLFENLAVFEGQGYNNTLHFNNTIQVFAKETINSKFELVLSDFDFSQVFVVYLLSIENLGDFSNALMFKSGTGSLSSYRNLDLTTSTETVTFVQSVSISFIKKYEALFKNTLINRNSNFIKSVQIFDHLGTKINFRTDYIIDNQVYKLASYEYNLETKLVNAKMILRNG